MKHFAKSILNYFATFNETRFRFGTKRLAYQWADHEHHSLDVLDLAVFPDVQSRILDGIAANQPINISVRLGEHVIYVNSRPLIDLLLVNIQKENGLPTLEEILGEHDFFAEDTPQPQDADRSDLFSLPIERQQKWLMACRDYNLRLRKEYSRGLLEIQQSKLNELKASLRLENAFPRVSLAARQEEQKFFNDLQALAAGTNRPADYVAAVQHHIESAISDFVLFDLFMVVSSFWQGIGTQSLYLFFHDIGRDDAARYPLFCAEIEVSTTGDAVTIRSLHDAFMLNTPAINSFEFDSVLTTPRACRFAEAMPALRPIEQFLQAKYNVAKPFLLERGFSPVVGDGLPDVRFRVALQAVGDEDRRILDYSELLTTLDKGVGRKFMDIVGQYVGGNVKNTWDAVNDAYGARYPHKSVDQLIHPASKIPLPLNESQKRILLAAENPANRIIVVDGPPGTGKSHTITALIYQANLLGKSVLVTSHKQQALDVIDNSLIEQFKTVHPRAKPPVLRLLSGETKSVNEAANTLSAPVINASSRRYQEDRTEAVERDRNTLLDVVRTSNADFWAGADVYPALLKDVFALSCLNQALFPEQSPESDSMVLPLATTEVGLEGAEIRRLAGAFSNIEVPISLQSLTAIAARRNELPSALEQCERLNELRRGLNPSLLALARPVPDAIDRFGSLMDELSLACCGDVAISVFTGNSVIISKESQLSLPDITTYRELCAVRDDLQIIAEDEKKLLGKIFKNKEAAKRRKGLARCPAVARRLAESSATDLLPQYMNAVAVVDAAITQMPWLHPDYFIHAHKKLPPARLAQLAASLHSLEFSEVASLVAVTDHGDFFKMSPDQILAILPGLRRLKDYQAMAAKLSAFATIAGIPNDDLPSLYAFLKEVTALMSVLGPKDISLLETLLQTYAPILRVAGVASENLQTLGVLTDASGKAANVLRYIELHGRLCRYPDLRPPSGQSIRDFYGKTHKLLEHELDGRFKNLQHFAGDVQRILIAIKSGKRITEDQAKTLFKSLACVIAEPGLISRHFPMTEDLVDYLIIDEASQVSIAESISLMLRAKQTIVFGDELQYGAVGAVNVAERYASQYFKDILRDYTLDTNEAISDAERDKIADDVARNVTDEDVESGGVYVVAPGTKEWLKTFSVRTSTLAFAKALKNYSDSLNIHFRSFPEIISYSNEFFYRQSQIDLVPNRIRTKPIVEVLRFIPVETKGNSGRNVNLDEIEAVKADLEQLHANGFKGTLGVICSFKEQASRMEELLRKELSFYTELERDHRFRVWFVGDVQGEERDLIYYSLVQDKKQGNADLVSIYPKVGGTADNIRRLKMQRLNVGFSRAKDTMVFVHSMSLAEYSDTRLGDALKHYWNIREACHDNYVADEAVFGSPAEKKLYSLIIQTPFYQRQRGNCRLMAQFEIGKYIRQEFHKFIPHYRVDFLMTLGQNGKEKSLIIEYDGVEFHTRNPDVVTAQTFDQEYLEYDIQRQLELESFGYGFLRINKFSLLPRRKGETPADVLNERLEKAFQ
jgi:very-short-patch-repair endonuclease